MVKTNCTPSVRVISFVSQPYIDIDGDLLTILTSPDAHFKYKSNVCWNNNSLILTFVTKLFDSCCLGESNSILIQSHRRFLSYPSQISFRLFKCYLGSNIFHLKTTPCSSSCNSIQQCSNLAIIPVWYLKSIIKTSLKG